MIIGLKSIAATPYVYKKLIIWRYQTLLSSFPKKLSSLLNILISQKKNFPKTKKDLYYENLPFHSLNQNILSLNQNTHSRNNFTFL